jgi:hypothetical protein
MDFKRLKAQSGKASLTAVIEKATEMKEARRSDDRFWSPTVDKAGNGYAVIRFLPPTSGEDTPFVRLFDHGFQGPGGWYIENSLTSIKQDDPVSEFNSKLWNSTTDDDSDERKQARKQKRRLHFISNIYVINDASNPENEWKVFLFKYGKKIFNKLAEAMEPQFVDEEAFNPFDLFAGANFKLKIRQVEGYRNYDKSEFEKMGELVVYPLLKDDELMEKIWKSQYPLQPFLDPANFKSYSELKAKLARVLAGSDADEASATRRATDHEEELEPKAGKTRSAPKTTRQTDDVPWNEEEADDMAYFKRLAS